MADSSTFLRHLFGLDEQVAVVIGGTGVLGGALCEGLAQAGAKVVVAGRSEERGQERVKAIAALGGEATFLPVNADERLSGTWQPVVATRGSLDLWKSTATKGATKGGVVRLVGQAVLPLMRAAQVRLPGGVVTTVGADPTPLIRVGIAIGR